MKRKYRTKTNPLQYIADTVYGALSPHTQVYLFGSRAKQQHKKNSDYDILIKDQQKIPFRTLYHIRQQLAQSPRSVDVVDYFRTSDTFQQETQRDLQPLPSPSISSD